MQCKDIPDRPILDFLAAVERGEIIQRYTIGGVTTVRPSAGATIFEGFENSVHRAIDHRYHQPNLVRAKMRSLIKRGLVSGCTCGCRGDFRLTPSGRANIEPEAS